jgi:hypothetical protein
MSEPLVGRSSAFGRAKTNRSIDPQGRQQHGRHDSSRSRSEHEQLVDHRQSEEREAHRVKDEFKSTSQLLNSHPVWNQHSLTAVDRS